MSGNPEWSPSDYLAFARERGRPAADLLSRVPDIAPSLVADLGCGPGNATALLKHRWPQARLLGVDDDSEMLRRARESGPEATWVKSDIRRWRAERPYDLLFSNAALHWLDDHESLLPDLLEQLRPGGVLAFQIPDCGHGAWREILRDLAGRAPWRRYLGDFAAVAFSLPLETYGQLLAPLSNHLDIWASEYLHRLEGASPLADWTEAAGARPYLQRLPADAREAFRADYRKELARAYPPDRKGVTNLLFRRLFLVAEKI